MALRLAVGARPAEVATLIVRSALRLGVLGGALGLGAAFVLGRALQSMVFGISPLDPLTRAGVALAVAAITLLAAAVPTWRTSRVDPAVALRQE